MGKDDLTLFVTSPGGTIISLKSPLQTPIEMLEFHIHNVDITQVAIRFIRDLLHKSSLLIVLFFLADRARLQ